MLTLIETNDQLNIASSKHQRAVLNARKAAGVATPSPAAEPQQNPMAVPQHVPGQNVYGGAPPPPPRASQPDHGPYSASPPRRQNNIASPVSPLRGEEETFAPPPGPPPSRVQQQNQVPPEPVSSQYDFANASAFSNQFSAPEQPPVPTRSTARPTSHAYSSSADYGVGENPFSDEAYGPSSPRKPTELQSDHSPPSRAPQGYSSNHYPQEMPSEQARPGPYNAGYQPTPSYVHRQESSADHLTMHGGSPPPSASVANGNSSNPPGSTYGSNPVSPVDDPHGVRQRMGDMHI